jgi:hypothetical protein
MKPGGAGLAGIAFGVGNDVSIGVDLLGKALAQWHLLWPK